MWARFCGCPVSPAIRIRTGSGYHQSTEVWISLLLAISLYHVPANLGYAVLFALILIESAGAPVPGETSLIAAGVLASSGNLSLPVVFAVAISAAIIGDNLGYLFGRRVGHRVLMAPGRWEQQRRQF